MYRGQQGGYINEYISQFNATINNQNGDKLSNFFNLESSVNKRVIKEVSSLSNVKRYCENQVAPPFNEALEYHFLSLISKQSDNFVDLYANQKETNLSAQRILKGESNWLTPALKVLNMQLRITAKKADQFLKKKGEKSDRREDSARVLTQEYQITVTDRAPLHLSKKW
eukprot:TRINITY_DN5769_c0_g1_i1.p2 TRINITY_DN5769_c0_g1~~TRINITY_DN5769_c0_g1_i1.p2  ORF type:complete len:169 (-),score=47.26 TRINITY_DN5769_c0_g1_i1:705-1211(-)